MKMSKIAVTLLAAASISLAGCNGQISNADVGTVAGGAIGGILGHSIGGGSGQILATVGGAVLGGFIGNAIGHSMDVTDQMRLQQAMNNNQTVSWQNQKTGDYYTVTPGKKAKNHCRSYTMTATVNGQQTPVKGRACYRNGQWVAVNS